MKKKTALIISLIALPLFAAAFILHAQTSADREAELARWEAFIADQQKTLDATEFDLQFTITDTDGKPLDGVSVEIEQDRPVLQQLLSGKSETKREKKTIDSRFRIQAKGWPSLELTFMKDGYYIETRRYHINFMPNDSRDLGPDGKPKLVMKEDIQVVMYKGVPAAELVGTTRGTLQYDFEKGMLTVADLSALDRKPEKKAVSGDEEDDEEEDYVEEKIRFEMKSVNLKVKVKPTKYIELDFRRDENGEVLFDGMLRDTPCPASFIIRLHSDDPDDGFVAVDQLKSGFVRHEEYDKRYPSAPETGYQKELVFDFGKQGADGKYQYESNYLFAFVKCGGHYGTVYIHPPVLDARLKTIQRVRVAFEQLFFNRVEGDRNVSDGGYYRYVAPRQPTEAEIKAAFEQKTERAKAQIKYLADALESYKLDVGTYPSELSGLVKNVDKSDRWDGPYIRSEVPRDPWGKDYQYSVDANKKTYRLVSSQEKLDDAPDRTDKTATRFKLGKNAYLEMVRVEPGKFQMGEGDQKHEVTISAPYWIGRYEVTRAQWQAIMGDQRDYAGDNRPVGHVSYDDVQEFCRLLNETVKAPDGYEFALPTEAQWEYAARGGAKSNGYQYSGSDKPDEVAWYNKTARYGVSVVGKKAPNELGLYDMSGSIMEWCADAYQEDISKHADGDTPVETGDKRVARGGYWDGKLEYCEVSARVAELPKKQYTSFGFRLAAVPVREKTASEKPNIAQTSSAEKMPETLSFYLAEGVPLEMVKVDAAGARFRMGEGYNSKTTPHFVSFKKDYYVGQYEVTQAQWNALMETNPSGFKGDDLPVESACWDEVAEFCRKLNETGKAPAGWEFTLPTEAQWEFAAKGGKKSKGYKFSGSDELEDVAWYNDNSGDVNLKGMKRDREYLVLRDKNNNRTHPVGTKKPNELGLYDMNGNVKEICLDSMDFNNSGYSDGDVAVPESRKTQKNTCVIRDIGFLGGAEMGFNTERTYTRRNGGDFDRSSIFGFRLALVRAPEKTDDDSYDDDSDDGDPNVMKVELPGGIPLKLVKVEAAGAEFKMKTRSGTSDYESEHPVRFRNDFYIGKYEITQEQWKAVMGTNPAHNQGDRNPVERVSWDVVLEFCSKLNAAGMAPDGWKFTLPTEAQWQYAARGGAKSKGYKYSGGDDPEEVAWCYDNFNDTKRSGENWDDEDLDRYNLSTHPVGQKKPNELGLYDMSGNVFELVLDSWRSRISDHIDGDTPETGGMNVAKLGGCFAAGSLLATPSYKTSAGPYGGYFMDGFRVALVKKPVFASSPEDSAIGIAPGANPAGQDAESDSLTVTVDGDVSFEFVKVPAAGRTITMKLRPESEGEKKSHTFYFHSDYYIGKYEVTQAQWQAFSRNESKDKGDDLPVDNVSWDDAAAFCKLLNVTGAAPEGWEFALPTEAQWEYAARGGAKSKGYVFSGGNDPDEVAWFLDNSGGKTHPVGQKKSNELGIYDMTGNVWEWCSDMCDGDYIRNTNGDMAPQKRSNAQLVYRGGGRGYEPWFCVVSNRCAFSTYYRLDRFGLRLALVRKRAELQKLAAEAADQAKGNDGEDDDDSDEEDEEDE